MHTVGGVPLSQVANTITIQPDVGKSNNIQQQLQSFKQQVQASKHSVNYTDNSQFTDAMTKY